MYKVFIVDDEPFIIEGLYDILDWSSFGLEIVGYAENGRQALDALATTPVDLLISDISMPVMNGLTLIAEARKLHPELKVIILSGFNEFDYLKEGMKLGIENYLLKPINVEELESTLRNTVEKMNSISSGELYSAFDVQILKDNTLYRWLTGQIEASEFRERMELLELDFENPYFVVAIVRSVGKTADGLNRLGALLQEEREVTSFRDRDGDLVLIGNLRHWTEGKKRFLDLLERLSYELIRLNEPAQIGVGSVFQPREEAAASYKEAKQALEYFMVLPDRLIIDYKLLEEKGKTSRIELPFQWEEYAKLILARDNEGLTHKIKDDFVQLQKLDGIRPEDLRNAALELVIRFKMELEQIKHTDESDIFKKGLGNVRSSDTFDHLVHSLQEVAKATVESLLQDVKNPVVNQVLAHIHEHYADELSLKTLGAQYHIHPVYLGQLFHKETGDSFAEYINKYRIEKAKEQLKNTNLKVHEIAKNVGYWETGYFYKQFRKYVGISPTDFKSLG
ncbi:response regulator transcription factor [Paenibacillus donghaensis]|uniref:response regulator transcription factor n=1 Tax=Paenibacillus donghaensis TaxID=414771 RepID=UPI001883D1F0|nr:response regulator transcription factor [Paenibacillus donghaensis]MBE9913627.1 response regulator transcription factor [Paenibacillus donghaensis]